MVWVLIDPRNIKPNVTCIVTLYIVSIYRKKWSQVYIRLFPVNLGGEVQEVQLGFRHGLNRWISAVNISWDLDFKTNRRL